MLKLYLEFITNIKQRKFVNLKWNEHRNKTKNHTTLHKYGEQNKIVMLRRQNHMKKNTKEKLNLVKTTYLNIRKRKKNWFRWLISNQKEST